MYEMSHTKLLLIQMTTNICQTCSLFNNFEEANKVLITATDSNGFGYYKCPTCFEHFTIEKCETLHKRIRVIDMKKIRNKFHLYMKQKLNFFYDKY